MVTYLFALFLKKLRWQKQRSISCPCCPPWMTSLTFSMRKNNRKPKKVATLHKCQEATAWKIWESRCSRDGFACSFHDRRVDKRTKEDCEFQDLSKSLFYRVLVYLTSRSGQTTWKVSSWLWLHGQFQSSDVCEMAPVFLLEFFVSTGW